MANFKLPMAEKPACKFPKYLIINSGEYIQATSSTPLEAKITDGDFRVKDGRKNPESIQKVRKVKVPIP